MKDDLPGPWKKHSELRRAARKAARVEAARTVPAISVWSDLLLVTATCSLLIVAGALLKFGWDLI